MKSFFVNAIAFLIYISPILGIEHDVYFPKSSKLQVQIPGRLRKEGGYDHRESLFGEYPYGSSIATNVFYAGPTNFCTDTTSSRDDSWTSPFILVIDRGDCTFVTKVRNAQHAGAVGVIIADNLCICSDTRCNSPERLCEADEPLMSDDGSGSDIVIPSFLIFKPDADMVKEELIQNVNTKDQVRMEMSWSLPKPDNRVEYDVWTVPTHSLNKEFLSNFGNIANALGSRAYFTPYMNIFDGAASGCHGFNDDGAICYTLCTNNGRYCASDPDGNLNRGISGADVVRESLRRICIWNKYGADDGIGTTWWNYVHEFTRLCNADADYFNNDNCVNDAYRHAKILKDDIDEINSCMTNSGGLEGNVQNVLLDRQIKAKEKTGVVIFPAVVVNNVPLRGALTVNTVFEAICSGFADGTKPTICNQCERCHNSQSDCIQDKGVCSINGATTTTTSGGGVSKVTFLFCILSLVAFLTGLSVFYSGRTRKEMRDNVRVIMSEYMLLEEANTNPEDRGLL